MKRSALNHYIHSHVHLGRIGVMLELGLETHMIVKSAAFQQLATDLCLQIAAQDPCDVAALLQQPYFKTLGASVEEHLDQAAAALQERVEVIRFVRWEAPAFRKEDELAPFERRL